MSNLEHFLLLVIKLVQQEKNFMLHVNLCNQSPGLAVKEINEQIKPLRVIRG